MRVIETEVDEKADSKEDGESRREQVKTGAGKRGEADITK